jgi:hypothetical protein
VGPQVAKTLDCCVTQGFSLWRPCIVTNSVVDRGCSAFFGPWIRDGKKPGSGIRDKHIGSYFRELRNNFLGQKYLNSLSIRCFGAGSGIRDGKIQIRDPGWKNPNPGSGIKIPEAQSSVSIFKDDLKPWSLCRGFLFDMLPRPWN